MKQIKFSFYIHAVLLIAAIVCSHVLHAGIYRVVVLQSPDGKQRVRLYFDNHTLGFKSDNDEQLQIIRKAVETFKAHKTPFTILVESPDFYQAPTQDYPEYKEPSAPEGEEWVLIQETQPITNEALKTGLGKFYVQRYSHASLLFSPIPLLGGIEQLSDTNLHIISIDVRNNLMNFENFINKKNFICDMLEESLEAVFKKTLEQIHAAKIKIPAKKSFHSGGQTGYLHTVKTSYNETLIKAFFLELDAEFERFLQDAQKNVGSEAWKCNIFEAIETVPGIDWKTKCNNYKKEQKNVAWDVPCYQKDRFLKNIIKRYLRRATEDQSYLEYDVLKYILTPIACDEIAVFVGGTHAAQLQSALKRFGYAPIYERGYSFEETLHFLSVHDRFIPYGKLSFYTLESSQTIKQALRESFGVGANFMSLPVKSPNIPVVESSFATREFIQRFIERARGQGLNISEQAQQKIIQQILDLEHVSKLEHIWKEEKLYSEEGELYITYLKEILHRHDSNPSRNNKVREAIAKELDHMKQKIEKSNQKAHDAKQKANDVLQKAKSVLGNEVIRIIKKEVMYKHLLKKYEQNPQNDHAKEAVLAELILMRQNIKESKQWITNVLKKVEQFELLEYVDQLFAQLEAEPIRLATGKERALVHKGGSASTEEENESPPVQPVVPMELTTKQSIKEPVQAPAAPIQEPAAESWFENWIPDIGSWTPAWLSGGTASEAGPAPKP